MSAILQLVASLLITMICISCSPRQTTKIESNTEESGTSIFKPTFIIPEVDAAYYEACIQKFSPRITDSIISTDLIKFRYSYLAHKEITGRYVPIDLEEEFGIAMKAKDNKKIEELADKILEIDFTDIRFHMMKAYAMKANGKDFEFHKIMVQRLEESILASGDGKSPETAFHVAQVKEEYAILNSFGLQVTSQSLSHMGNHSFDVMECQSKDGKNYTIYFDITEHIKALSEKFK